MNGYERAKILKTSTAVELRRFLESFAQDAGMLPKRSEALDRLDELLPDRRGVDLAPVRKALMTKAERIAQRAQDKSARFDIRGEIVETVVKVVPELDALDRVVQVPKAEELDVKAAADATEPWVDEELEAIQRGPEGIRR